MSEDDSKIAEEWHMRGWRVRMGRQRPLDVDSISRKSLRPRLSSLRS